MQKACFAHRSRACWALHHALSGTFTRHALPVPPPPKCTVSELAVDDLTPWAEPTEDGHGRSASTGESVGRSADLSLKEVMAKLTVRDAEDVEIRSRCHRSFLTAGVVPQVAAGLVAAAETRPEDPLEFLAAYLIRCAFFFAFVWPWARCCGY